MNTNSADATAVATAVFSACPNAALQARHMASHILTTVCDDPELRADAELTVSELVTNAAKAATSDVTVTVVAFPDGVHIEVMDQDSSHIPLQDAPGSDAEHGRGLLIVHQLSTRCGCDVIGTGKRVWADLDSRPVKPLLEQASLLSLALHPDDIAPVGPAAPVAPVS
ncbi:ATP-binding protein [Streptomyces sp. NPDC057375]|uniref:ATP-binding protein n=1 Tax=Streptomyces sp. NPDC057375 TaxID=3346109 RepID=UPI00362518D3